MAPSTAAPDSSPEAFLAARRERLEARIGRLLEPASGDSSEGEQRRFLREEAEELYWNELSWEKLTAEQRAEGAALVETVFAGFLALIQGLLLREATPDAPAPATPRPAVVEDVLRFLAGRCLALADREDDPVAAWEYELTWRLIDLVLYRLHDVPVDRAGRLGPRGADGSG